MNLRQAIFVMLGSEIGTTITAQIVAFKVKMIFYPLMPLGLALKVFSSKEKLKNTGEDPLFPGLDFSGHEDHGRRRKAPERIPPCSWNLLPGLVSFPCWAFVLALCSPPLPAAVPRPTSLVIAMSMEGVIDLRTGITLIIGANIGTCVLELIAAVGTNLAARRTGMAQFPDQCHRRPALLPLSQAFLPT